MLKYNSPKFESIILVTLFFVIEFFTFDYSDDFRNLKFMLLNLLQSSSQSFSQFHD